MANLGKKNGVYLARFRYKGAEYKRSLKTADRRAAEGAMHRVEDALHRLSVGLIHVPDGVDAGDFIVSGGTLQTPTAGPLPGTPIPTLAEAAVEYLDNLGHLAESNRYTVGVHLRNFQKQFPNLVTTPIDRVQRRDLEGFIQVRIKERARATVAKERETLIQFFAWALGYGYIGSSPADGLTRVPAGAKLPPFRTAAEIDAVIGRGGLSKPEEWALWDCVYLTPPEITSVLGLVRCRATRDVSFILHAIPAYTGMRRGEVLRLCWSDVEFDQGSLVARSRKQSRQEEETTRRIDMHGELKAVLLAWRKNRPRGQFVACDAGRLESLTPKEASQRFWQPLRGTRWCLASRKNRFKIGFHTYRHSLASNLAAAGVDQRVVDEILGHQTEAMRRRYRHLSPGSRRSAIECFSLANPD